MIDGLIAGRLYGQPKKGMSRNGSDYVMAKVRATGSDGENLFVSVITFSETAREALMALNDGDSVSLSGPLSVNVWTDRDGRARAGLDMQAHAVLTAYHVRKRRRDIEQSHANDMD